MENQKLIELLRATIATDPARRVMAEQQLRMVSVSLHCEIKLLCIIRLQLLED